MLIDLNDISKQEDNEAVLITQVHKVNQCQLSRMASAEHKKVEIKEAI